MMLSFAYQVLPIRQKAFFIQLSGDQFEQDLPQLSTVEPILVT